MSAELRQKVNAVVTTSFALRESRQQRKIARDALIYMLVSQRQGNIVPGAEAAIIEQARSNFQEAQDQHNECYRQHELAKRVLSDY